MMQLRDFQADLIGDAREHLRRGIKRLMVQLATGGGKTVIAAFIINGVRSRGLRVWFVVHRKELLKQTSRTFEEVGIPHGFVASGWPMNAFEKVLLCGVDTLRLRLATLPPPDVIVWDEAHHSVAQTWADIHAACPNAIHIGLSATPCDLAGRALGAYFDAMVCGPSTAKLIQMGYLSPYTYFAPGEPDLVGVKKVGPDFNRGDLSAIIDQPKLIGDVVEQYLEKAPGEQGIVFGVTREHSRHLADAFNGNGIPAAHVDGTMTQKERERFDHAFRAGDVRIGCNVDLFGEGYDVPHIGYVGLARSTTSLRLHRQQCGRVLRIFPGKEQGIICDHAGNALRGLGLPDDDVIWSLEGRQKSVGGQGPSDAIPIHQCPMCYQITRSAQVICPCGHLFHVEQRSPAFQAGNLFELQRLGVSAKEAAHHAKREREKAEERAAKSLGALLELARARNKLEPGRYSDPGKWAQMKIGFRQQARRGGFRKRA
jgi:DNA repair protein RadD